jgi:hypothetical protein
LLSDLFRSTYVEAWRYGSVVSYYGTKKVELSASQTCCCKSRGKELTVTKEQKAAWSAGIEGLS